jgi:4-hydroxybenzoate polyprenyltransferase
MLDRLGAFWPVFLNLIRWNRPAGWLLLLWPSLSALWLACGGWPGWHLLFVFVAGTILMRSAGCCINDVADREFDRHVKRTANRPVTSGQISPRLAVLLGALLALMAFGLILSINRVAVLWSFAALGVAVLYPYAKRLVSVPQAVLGVAFSFGIPLAFAAAQEHIPAWAWALMASNLFWVLAYDTEYAMVDRDDDLKIGIQTSAITFGRWDVAWVMSFYALHLLSWGLLLRAHLPGNGLVWALALGVTGLQVLWHFRLIRHRQREACFTAFKQNHWLGFTLFLGVVFSYV